MTSDKTDFTQGNILKKLVPFMIPILGALVLQAAYGAVDLLVVGRFGSTSGLSAVSTGSQVLNLVTFVVTQLAMGVTVCPDRPLSRGKEPGTDRLRHRRRGGCIHTAFCLPVRSDGFLCPPHLCTHAGSC